MRINRRSLLVGLMGMAPSAVAARLTPVERLIAARMAAKQIPGAGFSVVRRGRTVVCHGYGLANVEQSAIATATTLFPMASASKLLAGIAAMLLVEAGRLDLDAPVHTYVPEMQRLHGAVRVRQLLNLTSGLNGPGTDAAFRAEAQRREAQQLLVDAPRADASRVDASKQELFTPEELIAAAARLPAHAAPGMAWRYDQFPGFLFGQIVARVLGMSLGMSYDAFVGQAIFEKLGMRTAKFGDSSSVIAGRATSYSRETGVLREFTLRYTPSFWAAAGCNASAADMARLLSALRPGRLLQASSLRRMFQPTLLGTGEQVDYGLGCTISRGEGRTWIGHEGGGCCYLGWWPVEQLGIAVLFNLSGSKEDGIERKIAQVILG